jgi:4-aminobutyrate aminotransferase/(S)-3-amino-2-methylpropionate transaminase
MLIFDEIQSGFSRTGKWAAWQNYNITPDISTYAKSMGSGMPIAAVVGKAEIMDAAAPGTIGGTYIGNPVSCAAALATIQLIKDQNLNERGAYLGRIIRQRFESIQKQCPQIGEVRGLGAMMAIEFVKNNDPRQPNPELCAHIIKQCYNRGLILLSAGTFKNVIRILSPLVISEELLEKGLTILEEEIINSCSK